VNIIIALTLLAASHRNPFQYVEPPPVKATPKVIVQQAPPPPVIVQPVVEVQPGPPPPPHFPYELIGRFGLVRDPIVAFVGNGQVITVQIGDTIDDTFVVRSIGIESVEIGYVNRPETLRLQLDGSV